MKRYTISLFVLAALVLGLFFEPMAQAIPAGQRDVDLNSVSTTSAAGFVIVPGTSVTVNNGSATRNCVVQFSTEVATSLGDRTSLHYTINSTNPNNCFLIGAELFHAGNSTILETNTYIGVVTLGPGVHTIRPCFAAADINDDGGQLQSLSSAP